MKKLYKLLPLVMLLLLLCASLGAMTMASAESADTYSLTINYGTGCETVELTIPGQATVEMTSGRAYPIPKNNANIQIRVVLKAGYEIAEIRGTSGTYLLDQNNSRQWVFTADDTVSLVCRPKTYGIVYLPTLQDGYYTFPNDGSFPTEYTFGDSDTKISLPILDGFKFKHWMILASEDADDSTAQKLSPKEGEDFVVLSPTTLPTADKLYLKPQWEPLTYPVTRYDCVYDENKPSHVGSTLENGVVDLPDPYPMKSEITGNMGGEKHYPGFYYIPEEQYFTKNTVTVRDQANWGQVNIVYRLYLPIEYDLVFLPGYDGEIQFEEGATVPEHHVYNVATQLPTPVRTGYHFIGWTVKVIKNGTETTVSNITGQIGIMDEAYAGDKDTQLVLSANWKAKEYTVSIDKNTGAADDCYDYAEKYVFDQGLVIPDPQRKGYTFTGWLINGGTDLLTGTLDPFLYTDDISMVAQWQANEYTVTFDPNGAQSVGTTSLPVVFDTPLNVTELILPVREGHKFLGYTVTKDGTDFIINENGEFIPTLWNEYDCDTVLYAKWDVIPYEVTVNVTNAQVWLNDILYTGQPILFNYGTTLTVRVLATDGHKVVSWEGGAVAHAREYVGSFVVGTSNNVIDLSVLPMIDAPTFSVDYLGEVFFVENGIPDGNYRIVCGNEAMMIRAENGELYVGDVKVTKLTIPESFFGTTVQIQRLGNGMDSADSDAQEFALAARPAMPNLNDHIDGIYSDTTSIVIKLNTSSALTFEYEFALYLDKEGKLPVGEWQTAVRLPDGQMGYQFNGLNPGTYYFVYARVKASDGQYPHGQINIFQQNTYFEDYLNQKLADLQRLMQDGDGELVKALIEKAIADAKALPKPSATFYNDLEGIYNRAMIEIVFAREQDHRISDLNALCDAMIATRQFNENAEAVLITLRDGAIAQIMAAKTTDEVQTAYSTAHNAMSAVKISHLYHDILKVTAVEGFAQGTGLMVNRWENIDSLINSVNSAIQSGKISVAAGSAMSLAEATEALRTLDVMAAYTVRLTLNNATVTATAGGYEYRLHLSEDLRGISGLQVAFYNEKTGMLEIVDTVRDGNELVFSAGTIKDFVVLGDPTMNLIGVIGAMGVILLCQLIAIVILLVRRRRYANEVRHCSTILPVVLAIQFLPKNAILAISVLGALIVLFQIILIYLLLSSEVIYHRGRRYRRVKPEQSEPSVPVIAMQEDDAEDILSDGEEAPADDEVLSDDLDMLEEDSFDGEEAYTDADEEALDEYADEADEVSSEDLADLEALDGYNREAVEAIDPIFDEEGDYDFIEPAANPRYSLPDEEIVSEECAEEDNVEYAEADAQAFSDEEEPQGEAQFEEFYDDTVTEYEQLSYEEDGGTHWEYDADDAESQELAQTEELADEGKWSEDNAAVPAAEWEYDAEDADMSAENATEDFDEEAEALTEEEEAPVEEVEDEEPEIYIEPDARGDEAPAPEYYEDINEDETHR